MAEAALAAEEVSPAAVAALAVAEARAVFDEEIKKDRKKLSQFLRELLISVKTIFFPSDYICINIFPNFLIVFFASNYVVVI